VKDYEVKASDAEMLKAQRLYRFEVPVGAPYVEAEQVALELSEAIKQMAANAAEQAKKQAAEGEKTPVA
jgi:hypothetical protein